jgi:hypothetical protein
VLFTHSDTVWLLAFDAAVMRFMSSALSRKATSFPFASQSTFLKITKPAWVKPMREKSNRYWLRV